MSDIKVTTNNHVRPFIYGWQLTEEERQRFDYYGDKEILDQTFFGYKGEIYDLSDFMRVDKNSPLTGWEAYSSDSYFSGLVIKLAEDDYGETGVIVGWYCS